MKHEKTSKKFLVSQKSQSGFSGTKQKSNYKKMSIVLFSSLLFLILATAISAKTTYWIGDGVNLSIGPDDVMFFDTTNDRVGMGTTAPGYRLHLYDSASTGIINNIYSQTLSQSGKGVYGYASSTSGASVGVYGKSDSSAGAGLQGEASAVSGITYGVVGSSDSSTGVGVYGLSQYGVQGESTSSTGRGVYGTSPNEGVRGTTTDTSGGKGVYGYSSATTNVNYGVQGQSLSSGGIGVYGLSPNEGVRGTTTDTSGGKGVYGYSSATTNLNYGVHGQTDSNAGRGVYGSAVASSGYNYGVYGYTASTDGYAGYFTGGHGVVQGCPSGFTSIMPSAAVNNTRQLGCMQNTEEGTANWETAMQDCYATYGGRLPLMNEWYIAMNNFALSYETDDWEWTSSHYAEDYILIVGNGGITNRGWYSDGTSAAYRCWIEI